MQPHSLLLKFTPTQALINLASCALNAVYNNNIAANRAEPSMQTHTHTHERTCTHAHTHTSQRDRERGGGGEKERTSEEAPSQRIPRRAFVLS